MSEFGRIDVLVNNAAYQMSQPDGIAAISTAQFDRVVRTNLYGMFWLCKAALPHIPSGGSIINTTSVQAYKPSPHLLDYAMTKGAIVTFTQGLAQMLASDGIRVNAVAPGPVWTPLIPATMPDTTEFGKQSPLGRPAQPAEMAPAYVFLASSNASFITGEIMNATGGTPLPDSDSPVGPEGRRRTCAQITAKPLFSTHWPPTRGRENWRSPRPATNRRVEPIRRYAPSWATPCSSGTCSPSAGWTTAVRPPVCSGGRRH